MKIKLPQGIKINRRDFLRRQGYHPVPLPDGESYVKRLGRDYYPRFHIYVNGEYLNLHLDQKKASYKGQTGHSGEYDSEVVMREGNRLKMEIEKVMKKQIDNFNKREEFKTGGVFEKLFNFLNK
jgi:hypothetical protein